MKHLKKLLEKISNIIEIDKKIQEERRKRGEKFNVFNVLGLWSDEVRLHSAFLAELFNPNGKSWAWIYFFERICQYVGN